MDKLAEIRSQKDTFLARHPQSPLTSSQRQEFKSLDYFPEAPELRFELPIERFSDQQTIQNPDFHRGVPILSKVWKDPFPSG